MRLSLSLAATATLLIVACSRPQPERKAAAEATSPARSVATSDGSVSPATDSLSDRADKGRTLGDANAPLWIVEASDFQCPFCKQWHDSTMPPIIQNYVKTGKVRIAYINFPLQQHRNALPAAEAAMCAAVQNKFWPMHDSLFARQEKWGEKPTALPMFDTLATRVGVNLPQWRACMVSHSMVPLISADRDRGQQAGVQSTPTFFIGTQRVPGAGPKDGPAYPYFKMVIEAELAKLRGGSAKKPGT